MAYQTAAGASFGASAALPATFDAAGYGALTKTIVGEVTNIGDFFGREYAEVTHQPLDTRATKYAKGSFNNGTLAPSLALDPADAGQTIMTDGLASDDPISVCVTLQDGTEYWSTALVMTFMPNVGGVDDIVNAATSLRVVSDWVTIAAP